MRRLRIYPHALRDRNAFYSPDEEGAAVRLLSGRHQGRDKHAGHAGLHLPVARHHRPRDDARAARRRASALQRAGQSATSWRSTRPSPTSSRCSSTSPIRACCATRSRARAAIWPARTSSASSRSSSAGVRPRQRAARRAGQRSIRRPASGSRTNPDVRALDSTPRAARPRRDPRRGRVRRLPEGLPSAHRSTSTASPARAPACCARATSIRILPTAWPTRPRAVRTLRAADVHPRDRLLPAGRASRSATTCARIVTADYDLNPDDTYGYRLAFVESFRQWGIQPGGHAQHVGREPALADRRDGRGEAGVLLDTRGRCKALFAEEQRSRLVRSRGARRKKTRPRWRAPAALGPGKRSLQDVGRRRGERGRPLGLADEGQGTESSRGIRPRPRRRQSPAHRVPLATSSERVAVEVHSVRRALRASPRGETVSGPGGRDHAAPPRLFRPGRAEGEWTSRASDPPTTKATSAIAPDARC